MLRVIVATTDASRAAHVGGPVQVTYKTFDIDAPEVEAFMAQAYPRNQFWDRTLVGVEILDAKDQSR